MSELWWPEQKALVMSIVEGKVREDEEPSSICSHLDPSLQGPGVTAPRGLSNARTFMQRELLITAPGKVTGLLSGQNFIVVAVAKPRKKMEKRIIFTELFPLKHTKLVNILGFVFLPAYAIPWLSNS